MWRRLAAGLAVGSVLLALSPPGRAQTPRGSEIIDRLNRSSTRPLPALPPAPAPRRDSIWVPDRYLALPGVPGPIHVPGHWEQQVSPYETYAPPLVGDAPDGGKVFFPGGVRPLPEQRQSP